MAPSRLSLKRSLLLSCFLAISLFSAAGLAQGNQQTTPKNGQTTPTPAGPTPTTAKGQTTANQQPTTSPKTDKTSLPNLPGLSSSTQAANTDKIPGLPTLSKTVDNSIPTYPPPSPPPVGNAPFMNRSTLPDGTVFIAVGAILGLFGAVILIWRGTVAYLLKRSVERAAMAQHVTNDKVAATFPAPPDTFYKYKDLDSSPSLALGGLVAANRAGQRRTHRGPPVPSTTRSQTNLFFSPTASHAAGGTVNSASRDSRFLPSGFYAATSATPAGSQGGGGHSISLSNLNPTNMRGGGYARPSPPESPDMGPRTTPPGLRNYSTSSISLNRAPSGRAPSAYLEDMLDDQPGLFPPAGGPPAQQGGGHYRSYSGGQQPRY